MNDHLKKLEELAEATATWLGSPASILVHSVIFIGIFALHFLGVTWNSILLVLTTLVSLEAIYFSIFIQMTVTKHSRHLKKHGKSLVNLAEELHNKKKKKK